MFLKVKTYVVMYLTVNLMGKPGYSVHKAL